MGRTDALAQAAVTAELCGFDRDATGGSTDLSVFGIRSVLIAAASAVWEWPSSIDALGQRFDAAVAERRRIESILALSPAAAPDNRRTGLFATDGCSDAERARIVALTGLTTTDASARGDGG